MIRSIGTALQQGIRQRTGRFVNMSGIWNSIRRFGGGV